MGVDVAKTTLAIRTTWQDAGVTVENTPSAIRHYLRGLPGRVALAVEATGHYHQALIQQAQALGHTVYVIDGYRLSRYRDSVGVRAKTDACDAALILRYLTHEHTQLRPWTPPPAAYTDLQHLLHHRALLILQRTQLSQSLEALGDGVGERALRTAYKALMAHFDRVLKHLLATLQARLQQAGWADDVKRCRQIEGLGPLSAGMLVTHFHRGPFRNADAFIAFLGMDVRVRDSGTFRGRRKLTQKGDPEARRLLYLAAMAARRSQAWKRFYDRTLARGLSRIQALVCLARKLARVAYALLRDQSQYQPKMIQPKIIQEACTGT